MFTSLIIYKFSKHKLILFENQNYPLSISSTFNISPDTLDSWIDNLRILRNKLAHNMRLYNMTFHKTPKLEKHHSVRITNNRMFANFIFLKYLLGDSKNWRSSVKF
ncbi:Abi family protein [Streptococcus sp. FT1-55]|uniref:Abi family protein n=1 Tax=Streptococcus sp. FT1-55 TaxID=3409805 RepID=UPI003BF4ED05